MDAYQANPPYSQLPPPSYHGEAVLVIPSRTDFQTGLFDCFTDVETCLASWFCSPCTLGCNAAGISRLRRSPPPPPGSSLWSCSCSSCDLCPCLVATVFPITALCFNCMQRRDYREAVRMPSDSTCDCLSAFFCLCCSQAQLARELKSYVPVEGQSSHQQIRSPVYAPSQYLPQQQQPHQPPMMVAGYGSAPSAPNEYQNPYSKCRF